jgi:uncharacterized membrane protein YphA (DoxX/SURF4 family)
MSVAKFLPVVVRILLGALFAISGANKLVPLFPYPPMPPAAGAFIGAMVATGYMLTVLGAIEVIAGVLLIVGRFVPLALTMLAPLVVNIALFHTLLAPAPGVVVFLIAAEGYLAWVYREAFVGLLEGRRRAQAASVSTSVNREAARAQ